MNNPFQDRTAALQAQIAKNGLDLVAISAGPSQVYFSGLHFHLSERPAVLLIGKNNTPAFIFPAFEAGKVQAAPLALEMFPYSEDISDWQRAFRDAINHFNAGNRCIGVEATSMRFLEMDLLKNADHNITFTSADNLIAPLRSRKDQQELQAIRAAIAIAEKALTSTIPHIKAGVSEKEVANLLVANLLREGSDPDLPFFPIVASGPNSANPHAVPGSRLLQTGDLLIIDWGARVDGYISDITRTIAIGPISSQLREIYETVRTANQKARALSVSHLTAGLIDHEARHVITTAGYGEQFIHRTGHGYGMEAHEPPYITDGSSQAILPGMAFTIEPGIYLPGVGGVRIEDDMLALDGALETLTTLERDLISL
jgi:Xaa-Pro dipeptidase